MYTVLGGNKKNKNIYIKITKRNRPFYSHSLNSYLFYLFLSLYIYITESKQHIFRVKFRIFNGILRNQTLRKHAYVFEIVDIVICIILQFNL